MHAFEHYYHKFNRDTKNSKKDVERMKKNFLSKYYPWIRRVFIAVENLINEIDTPDETVLTTGEVTQFGKILTEMYSHEVETEIESMLVAITKLTNLQVRIWTRLNKAL